MRKQRINNKIAFLLLLFGGGFFGLTKGSFLFRIGIYLIFIIYYSQFIIIFFMSIVQLTKTKQALYKGLTLEEKEGLFLDLFQELYQQNLENIDLKHLSLQDQIAIQKAVEESKQKNTKVVSPEKLDDYLDFLKQND